VCGGLEARLDITGERCPFTWVRTRLVLEEMRVGGLVDVLMREGEAARNVPRTAREEGHAVVCEGAVGDGRYRALVRKAA
jgi:TusA-related sulfurtransferase